MKEYDFAANNFYTKQGLKSLPLGSWDLFSSGFNTLCSGLSEVKNLKSFALTHKWEDTSSFEKEILEDNHIVVVTDTNLTIVHASKSIYGMNGYLPQEIIGKKPKLFQGEKTCQETSLRIRKAIENREPFEEVILNYRKDGSTYKCWIKGAPVKDVHGQVVNFIAFELEVA